jgi:hypothetical protein
MIRTRVVLRLFVALALLVAAAMAVPLALSVVGQWREERAEAADVVPASDDEQRQIVRAIILDQLRAEPICYLLRPCRGPVIQFDHRAATLKRLDADNLSPDDVYLTYDTRQAIDGYLDFRAPPRLIDRLAEVVQVDAENADPAIAGVLYVNDGRPWPTPAAPTRCTDSEDMRRMRISRAAVQRSTGMALALMTTAFCDGSGRSSFYKLERKGEAWVVVFWT